MSINCENNIEQINRLIKLIDSMMTDVNVLAIQAKDNGQHILADCYDDTNLYLLTALEQLETTKDIKR